MITLYLIKKEKEKTKKDVKNTGQEDQWIENIRKKIEDSLILNDQIKLNEPKKDYYEELLKFGKLIEEEQKENKNFPELSDEAYEDIEEAIGPGSENEVLIEEFNIPIKRHDIRTLINGEWLNDEIINFYGNLIMERSKNTTNEYPPVYFFNTFFYGTLSSTGYRAVRRWTRKFDLFLYDFVIVPIHLGNHWCCSAINFKKKRFEYYDSLHGSDRNALYILRNYIQEESRDKKKCEYDFTGWENYCPKDIPSQLNGYDCGIFTLLFAEYISREEEFDFDQSHIEYVRDRIIYEILNKKLLID
ncbi:cysteine proteinase [Piromyces finnis]|uniref:Cysteine proteinase n=1 Tax=Piromyces finnis TaxID=1754191 RepID=A0A1Y1VLK6_9FUNG|nr:cysteine proteinase [Piromyces finnis]|eukprot:ORX59347.1 cysteine proteinase [Piromyces finnis]